MHVFWDLVIRPALEAAGARSVVEIGAAAADHTRRLAEYCARAGGHLHSIDPDPAYDAHAFAAAHPGHFTSHTTTSLEALPRIPAPDAVLVDGDHNWYTVFHELRLLEERARAAGAGFPLVLLHDVAWPFARRDMYYAPERIPTERRHPSSGLGVERGNPGVVASGGFGVGIEKAAQEGGARNGVLTAVEEFVRDSAIALRLEVLPALWGLGVLASADLLERRPALRDLLDSFATPAFRDRLLELTEAVRGEEWTRTHADVARLAATIEPLEMVLIKHRLEHERLRHELADASLRALAPAGGGEPRLSLVVVVFDMDRAAPRTLRSLARPYQRGLEAEDYEVIVVDNGSPRPLDPAIIASCGRNFRLLRIEPPDASPSPAAAVNRGIAAARGELVGVMVDGARLATPGLLARALEAAATAPRAVVCTTGWTLGHEPQNTAVARGYGEAAEDALLAGIRWPEEPYRLFEIATLDGSSRLLGPIAESNALFTRRELWRALGGMDERFDQPGGGFANLDLLERALELPGTEMVLLLGEATFHQMHRGVSTNSLPWQLARDLEQWNRHFQNLRGRDWHLPSQRLRFYGGLPDEVRAHLVAWGVNQAMGKLDELGGELRRFQDELAAATTKPTRRGSRLGRALRRLRGGAPRNS